MQTKKIMVACTLGDSPALGNVWCVTAKKTDFYLDPLGETGTAIHLSAHGPNDRNPDRHRFHVKIDRRAAASVKDEGHFIQSNIPRGGWPLDGRVVAPRAFLIARVRWSWDLQRPGFRQAAYSGPPPEIVENRSGVKLSSELPPNDAADLDLIVSYDRPFWPNAPGSLRDNARLGPLQNDAGLWLTGTSYQRSQKKYPAPDGLIPPLPGRDEEPNRIMCGAPGGPEGSNMYWFVETITSRQYLEANR